MEKTQRRRSSIARGRRSSIGFPKLNSSALEHKDESEDWDKVLLNCFTTALQNSLKEIQCKEQRDAVEAEMMDIARKVITEMDIKKECCSDKSNEGQNQMQVTMEKYLKQLETECQDWETVKEKYSNEDTSNFAKSKSAPPIVKPQPTFENYVSLRKELNSNEEALFIKISSTLQAVKAKTNEIFNLQKTIKTASSQQRFEITDVNPLAGTKEMPSAITDLSLVD